MKLVDVMSRGVDPIAPSCTVQEAATRMAEDDVGAVLIGSAKSLEGILTDRDIIIRVVVEGRNPAEVTAGEIMSSTLFTIQDDATLEAALQEMDDRQIRRMPVRDSEGQLVGMVTYRDLKRRLGESEEPEHALRDIAEPHRNGQIAEPGDKPRDVPAPQ